MKGCRLIVLFLLSNTLAAFASEPEGRPSSHAAKESLRKLNLQKASCCPGSKVLRDQLYPKLLNCRKAGESCFQSIEQHLQTFDLKGCNLPPDPRSALAAMFVEDAVASDVIRSRPESKLKRGNREMSGWFENLRNANNAAAVDELRKSFSLAGPPEIQDSEAARQARLFMNVALLRKEALRLRSEESALRKLSSDSSKIDSPHAVAYLSNAVSKKAYADYYEAGAEQLLDNQFIGRERQQHSLADIEAGLLDAQVPLPRRIEKSGLVIGLDHQFAELAMISGVGQRATASGRSMVQSKVAGSFGNMELTNLHNRDLPAAGQGESNLVNRLEAAWRDVENGRDPADISRLLVQVAKIPNLAQNPNFCALRARALQTDPGYKFAYSKSQSDLRPESVWKTVDKLDKFTKHTQQQETGDASCLGHSVAAVMQSFPAVRGIDPYRVYRHLSDGEFGASADLADNLKRLSSNTGWSQGYRITGHTMLQDPRGPKLEMAKLKELVDQNQFPIVTLATQARIQREDWIHPIKSPMQHAAVVIGYGNAYDPFTGQNENYILLRDSFSRQGYPVKMRAQDFQKQLVRAGLIDGVEK